MRRPVRVLALAFGLLGSAGPLAAQDVELLGRRYGTTPPAGYFERLSQDANAFQFRRGWRSTVRLRSEVGERNEARARAGGGLLEASASVAGVLGRRDDGVEGTFRFPLILGLFADSASFPAFDRDRVQEHFLDGPNPEGTLTDYYRAVSGGRVELLGTAFEWSRAGLARRDVAGGSSGLGNSARVGEYIVDLLVQMDDGSIDWGEFDNDGPDGVPNSGDDDGFVDILTVMHPTQGAECGGFDAADRIWSHRWSLGSSFDVFVTSSPSNSTESESDRIRVDDYTVQPLLSCVIQEINQIGVFAHELGHGFGLPDLYAVGGSHAGIGQWGLMGTGSWGCKGTNPATPCHMGAWSKEVLGWAEVVDVPAGTPVADFTLNSVSDGGRILRVGSQEPGGSYLLLENRQSAGFDRDIYKPGLLIWRIDPVVLSARWSVNRVNADAGRQGVSVIQADGDRELEQARGGRGDGGDIYPGDTDNDAFHAGTTPGAVDGEGVPFGVTIANIELAVPHVSFRLANRMTVLTIHQEGPEGLGVSVKLGETPVGPDPDGVFRIEAAPFQTVTLDAVSAPGTEEGVRIGFSGWEDGSGRFRELEVPMGDTTLVAYFSGEEIRLDLTVESPAVGINPGSVQVTPESLDGWYPRGGTVLAEGQPGTGFEFLDWGGALAGSANPVSLTLDEPRSVSATFGVTYGFQDVPPLGVSLEAAVPAQLVFTVENALNPVHWVVESGTLPLWMFMDPLGRIRGAPLEVGTFEAVVRATDAQGLTITTPVSIVVTEPVIGAEALAGPFLLTGAGPTELQLTFLDRSGNFSGSYDLGDLRAFIQRNPGLPLTADIPEPVVQFLRLGRVGGAR